MDNEFFSPLTVVKRLAPLCLVVTLAYTFGWTAFIAQHEVRTGNHPDLESTAIATAERVGQVDTLILGRVDIARLRLCKSEIWGDGAHKRRSTTLWIPAFAGMTG